MFMPAGAAGRCFSRTGPPGCTARKDGPGARRRPARAGATCETGCARATGCRRRGRRGGMSTETNKSRARAYFERLAGEELVLVLVFGLFLLFVVVVLCGCVVVF